LAKRRRRLILRSERRNMRRIRRNGKVIRSLWIIYEKRNINSEKSESRNEKKRRKEGQSD
jgi:hypothetical protein